MIVSINQLAYLPWLGYFHRIAVSDVHIVLDNVQFEKNSFVNRNKIRTREGWCWLTVPVKTKGKFGALPICELEIDDSSHWREKHWKSICQNYSHAPYFADHAAFFQSVYEKPCRHLFELCSTITHYLLDALGISIPIRLSSEMQPWGAKDELVLNLCKSVGADVYLSGPLGRNYLRESLFHDAEIKVVYQDYHHPVYPQWRGEGFISNVSAIDLLFNCGPESLAILLSGQEPIRQ